MIFQHIICKLGNMRKEVEWTVYPFEQGDIDIKIQSDRRIAMVNLVTKKAILSRSMMSNGFHALMTEMGATYVDCPEEVIDQLKKMNPTGRTVTICG